MLVQYINCDVRHGTRDRMNMRHRRRRYVCAGKAGVSVAKIICYTRSVFMKCLLYLCLAVLLLASSGSACAADAAAGAVSGKVPQPPAKAQPDTPVKTETRGTAVAVIHEGTDNIGARLAMRLKERFNASNLFKLEEKDQPKLRLLLNTMEEFPSRGGLGSVYSITWVFSQSEGHLAYLLARDVGVLTLEGVDALTDSLVQRTDGIGVKYGYLFK